MSAVPSPVAVLEQERKRAAREALELAAMQQIRALGLANGMERQHRFHPQRAWAFDFAWPAHRLALEVEGGTWTGGRHVRGAGYAKDCVKYAEAVLLGWRVLRATGEQVKRGVAADWLVRALSGVPA